MHTKPTLKLLKIAFWALMHAFLAITGAHAQQPGNLDLSFNPTTYGNYGNGANNAVHAISNTVNGKFAIGGNFTQYNDLQRGQVARINPDGSVDTSFITGTGATGVTNNHYVKTVVIQPDEKIIIGGGFSEYNGTSANSIARLNYDGTLDTTFQVGAGFAGPVWASAIQPDGKIILGGEFSSYNGAVAKDLVRLNPDGTLDVTFASGTDIFGTGTNTSWVKAIALQPDGKIVISGIFNSVHGVAYAGISRLNSDGSLDTSFAAAPGQSSVNVHSVAIQPDGKILACGNISLYNGAPLEDVVRLNSDGTLDAGFNTATGLGPALNTPWVIASQPDGKILIGGTFDYYNGVPMKNLVRLNANGSVDTTFAPSVHAVASNSTFNKHIFAVAVLADGKILAGGHTFSNNVLGRNALVRLNANGTTDLAFNPRTGADGMVRSVAVQPDDKIIISGDFTSYNGIPRNKVARLNADGTLDLSFDVAAGPDNYATSIAIQPDDKIILAGVFSTFNGVSHNGIIRLNSDGSIDSAFNTGTGFNFQFNTGVEMVLLLQPDGKIVVGGWFLEYNGTPVNSIARLNPDGTLDNSFNQGSGITELSGTPGWVKSLALQADSKLIVAGHFSHYNNVVCRGLGRLNPDGSLDNSFSSGTGIDGNTGESIDAIALQPDNKIVIGGWFASYNGTSAQYAARINTDGSVDTGFNPPFIISGVTDIEVQQNGKLLFTRGGFFLPTAISRLNPDGTLDTDFQADSVFNHVVSSIARQSDGNIIAVGFYSRVNGVGRNRVARLFGNGNGINTGAITPAAFCHGTTIDVPYYATGTYNSGNIFTAQLSDAEGSFAAPVNIGTVSDTVSGIISATIPATALPGTKYRIRVISSSPIAVGADNYSDLAVTSFAILPGASSDTIAPGNLLTLFVNNPDSSLTYTWSGPGLNQTTGDTVTSTPITNGNVTYTVTASDGSCSSFETITVLVDPALGTQNNVRVDFSAVYPNPFRNSFNINFTSASSSTEIIITDVLGRKIFNKTYQTQTGQNFLQIQPENQLPQGLFLLQIKQENQTQTVRIVKQ